MGKETVLLVAANETTTMHQQVAGISHEREQEA